MRYAISILLLPILFLIGCTAVTNDEGAAETAADPSQLLGHWQLVELNGQPPLATTDVTLIIESDSIGGNASCNSYGGSYTADADGRIEMSEIFSTLMACLEDGVMEQEAAFNMALYEARTFELADNGQTLLLRNEAGQIILRFVAYTPEVSESLELWGQTWELTTVVQGETASSLLLGSLVTLTFDPDAGQLHGSAGCNEYGAPYTLNRDRLTIAPPASTRMYCEEPEGLMEQESQFLSWLEDVERFELDGRQLALYLDDGRMLLFQPVV